MIGTQLENPLRNDAVLGQPRLEATPVRTAHRKRDNRVCTNISRPADVRVGLRGNEHEFFLKSRKQFELWRRHGVRDERGVYLPA